jgi:hypothetical protein
VPPLEEQALEAFLAHADEALRRMPTTRLENLLDRLYAWLMQVGTDVSASLLAEDCFARAIPVKRRLSWVRVESRALTHAGTDDTRVDVSCVDVFTFPVLLPFRCLWATHVGAM